MSVELKDITSLNFENALAELEKIVKHLDVGISLDEMIKYHKYATELKKHCETILESAKLRLNTIGEDSN